MIVENSKSLNKLFDLLLNNSPDLLWAKDLDKKFLFANKKACNLLFNVEDPSEMVGKTDLYFVERERAKHPENKEWHTFGEICIDSDEVVIKAKEPMRFDEFGNTMGKFLYLDVHKAPIWDENGEMIGIIGSARDITHEKQLEAKLLKEEEKIKKSVRQLSALVEFQQQGILFEDENRAVVFANQEFCRIFNISEPSLITNEDCKKLADISKNIFKEPGVFLENIIKRIAEKKPVLSETLEMIDGRVLERDYIPVDIDNETKGNYWIYRDITDTKKMEESIQRQLKFANALNEISGVIISTDEKNVILEKTNEILGITLDVDRCLIYDVDIEMGVLTAFTEWLNPKFPDINGTKGIYPIDLFRSGMRELQETRCYHESHIDQISPLLIIDNSYKLLHDIMEIKSGLWYPFAFSDEHFYMIVLNSVKEIRKWTRDEILFLESVSKQISITIEKIRLIDKKKEVEEKILKLSKAVEQSPASIIITDLDGTIEYINPKFIESTGFTQNDLIGESIKILDTVVVGPELLESLYTAIHSGNEWKGEFQNKKKNGEMYWASTVVSPIKDDTGNFNHYLGIVEDITEQKKIQEELKVAKELAEESNKLKTSLLANMSHEFRTPINGIIGSATILNHHLENEFQKKMIDGVLISSRRLMDTLDSVLELANLEANFSIRTEGVTNIIEFITGQVERFKISAIYKKLEFRSNITPEKIYVDYNSKYVQIIITQLLNNAIKYTEKGNVEIKVTEIGQGIKPYLKIEVSDTGIGISEEFQKIIFDDFRQESEGINRRYEGVGIGLSLVRKLVSLLNGKIFLESKKNNGSKFTVLLPSIVVEPFIEVANEAFETVTGGTHTEEENSIPKILIVEDNFLNRIVMVNYLNEICNVEVCINGENAVKLAKKIQFDLVLMDINLGSGMDGIEAMKEIRKAGNYFNTPFIAVTGYALDWEVESFLEVGFMQVLTKPYEKYQLMDIVKQVFKLE